MAEFLQLRLCVLLSPLVACCNVSAARPPAALNLKPENPCMRLTSTAIDVIGVNPWPGPAFRGMGGGAFGRGTCPAEATHPMLQKCFCGLTRRVRVQ